MPKFRNVIVQPNQPASDEKVLEWSVRIVNQTLYLYCNDIIVFQCDKDGLCYLWKDDLEKEGLRGL